MLTAAATPPALLALLLAPPVAPRVESKPLDCPADTVPVVGTHVEQLQRLCLKTHPATKCIAFLPGLAFLEPRFTPVRTCMDRYEWPNKKGAEPKVMLRFVDAEEACEKRGRRLCTEFEWELACEGPEHRPWPYGWQAEKGRCNVDAPYRPIYEARLSSSNRQEREREVRRLWQGAPSGAHPGCRSAFGVEDLIGNVEEWVATSRPEWPHRSSLKGGFWSKPWAGCRGTNEGHDPYFRFYEIGFRCCHDPDAPAPGPPSSPSG